jgi:hypothetical protein
MLDSRGGKRAATLYNGAPIKAKETEGRTEETSRPKQ